MKWKLCLILSFLIGLNVAISKVHQIKLEKSTVKLSPEQKKHLFNEFSKFRNFEDFINYHGGETTHNTRHLRRLKPFYSEFKKKTTRNLQGNVDVEDLISNAYESGYYTAYLNIGTPAQSFLVEIDTGSSDIWMPSVNCQGCYEGFNPSSSSTFVQGSTPFQITYGYGNNSVSGTSVTDNIEFAELTLKQFQWNLVTQETGFNSPPPFGLGWPQLSVNGSPNIILTFQQAGFISEAVFSLYLTETGDNSIIFIGGVDTNYYTGSITYLPLFSQTYWEVQWSGLTINSVNYPPPSQTVFFDTGTYFIGSNQAYVTTITNLIGTAQCGNYSNLPNIYVNFNNFAPVLVPSSYMITDSSSPGLCVLAMSALFVANSSILGTTFINAYYFVFDYTNSQVGIASLNPNLS